MSQGFKRDSKKRTESPAYLFLQSIQQFKIVTRGTNADVQKYFIYGNKLHRTNQGSNFLEGSISNRGNVRAPIQFRRKVNPSILKDDFYPFIFTSIASDLLDQSNETSSVIPAFKSTGPFLPQSTVSWKSDSSSEANSSCCQRSDS